MGGAVSLMPVDIVDKEVMANIDDIHRSKIDKLVKQKDDDLILTTDYAMVKILKSDYKNTPYDKKEKEIILPVGYFELDVGDMKIDITIEQETILHTPDDVEENDEYLILVYGKDDKIITVRPIAKDYAKLAKVMDANIGGKTAWGNDPSKLMKNAMKSNNSLSKSTQRYVEFYNLITKN